MQTSDDFIFVVCTGGRRWVDRTTVKNALLNLKAKNNLFVVHGDCPSGADALVSQVCNDIGISQIKFPATWNRLGKSAGPIRNSWMLKFFEPVIVIAFHENLDQSKGTADTVRKAHQLGIPVLVISERMDEFDPRFGLLSSLQVRS
jgi:hypothetical protein